MIVVLGGNVRSRERSAIDYEFRTVTKTNTYGTRHVCSRTDRERRIGEIGCCSRRISQRSVSNLASVTEEPRVAAGHRIRDGLLGAAEVEEAGNGIRVVRGRERIHACARTRKRELCAARDRDRPVREAGRRDVDRPCARRHRDVRERPGVVGDRVGGKRTRLEVGRVVGGHRLRGIPVRRRRPFLVGASARPREGVGMRREREQDCTRHREKAAGKLPNAQALILFALLHHRLL